MSTTTTTTTVNHLFHMPRVSATAPDGGPHTAECQAYQLRHAIALAEITLLQALYRHQYPHHCRTCGGTGYHGGRGYSPLDPWDCPDPCSACVEQGICPRCGASHHAWDDGDEVPCPACGWNWGQGAADALPGDDYDGEPCCCPEPPYLPTAEETADLMRQIEDGTADRAYDAWRERTSAHHISRF